MEYLQNGIEVSYHQNGESKSDIIYIADFNNPSNNSFIVANQWTFIENSNKRPDILLFLNGLPICLFELKSPSREQTDASEADSMGVPAASGGRAIRGSAIAPASSLRLRLRCGGRLRRRYYPLRISGHILKICRISHISPHSAH